jgi:ABC-type phosphate transport system permease subunit
VSATATTVPGGRSVLERSPAARLPDRVLKFGLTALAVAILILLGYFFVRLIGESGDALNQFGASFVFGNDWDVSRNIYHGAPLVIGTLITSAIALIIGVPIAVATALFIAEL